MRCRSSRLKRLRTRIRSNCPMTCRGESSGFCRRVREMSQMAGKSILLRLVRTIAWGRRSRFFPIWLGSVRLVRDAKAKPLYPAHCFVGFGCAGGGALSALEGSAGGGAVAAGVRCDCVCEFETFAGGDAL